MKILLCTNTFENVVNGPAKFANLILEINQLHPQHEVRILTEDTSQPHPNVHRIVLRIPGFLYVFSQIFRMFSYHRHAVRLREAFPYDVLVYNNAFIGLWSALVSRQPTIGMINDDNNLNAGLSAWFQRKCSFKQLFFKQLEGISARRHRLIISNSDYLTKQLGQAYQLPDKRIKRLYKAIDLNETSFQVTRAFNNPIRILFVKADYMRGGLDTLADALKQLSQFSFVLTVIGPEKRFSPPITSLYQSVANVQLHLLNEQPPSVVRTHLQTNDIFCVPSRREALGVANIEALAAGIPVVATNVGGIPEVMDDGNNGWLVPPNNPAALAEAIQTCMTDATQRREKRENGRKFVQKFSKEAMFANFLRILESV